MDREAWHAAIHGVAKSGTRLSDWTELNLMVNQRPSARKNWVFSSKRKILRKHLFPQLGPCGVLVPEASLPFFRVDFLWRWCTCIRASPGGTSGKEPVCQRRTFKSLGFDPWVGKIPWRRKWQPTLVFLPGKSHGQRSLARYSSQERKESDMTEQLTNTGLHFSARMPL